MLKGKGKAEITDYVTEEMVCDGVGEIMQSSTMLNELVADDRNLVEKILQGIHDILIKVRAYLSGDVKLSAEQKSSFTALRDSLSEIEQILDEALRKRQETHGGVENDVVARKDEREYYAVADTKGPSIKEQIKKHLNELEKIGVVAKVEIIPVPQKGDYAYIETVIDNFKNKYGLVGRETSILYSALGEVEISTKEIRAAFRYLNTPEEFSAIFSIPEVVENGIRVDDDTHINHKDRGYPTYTIAAPVDIGGVTSYVGVVLKETGKLKYKMHRILLPNGKSVEIKKRISGYSAEMTAENDGESPAITTDSKSSIPQPDPKVKSENTTDSNSMQNDENYSSDERADLSADDIALLDEINGFNSDTTEASAETSPNGEYKSVYTRAEFEAERKRAEHFKNELRLTKSPKPDTKSLKAAVEDYIKNYKGSKTKDELLADFEGLYTLAHSYAEQVARVERSKDPEKAQRAADKLYRDLIRTAEEISADIVQNTFVENASLAATYKDIRRTLRSYEGLKISPKDKADLESLGGYNGLRKRNIGRFNLSTARGTAVDTVWMELQSLFPGYFPEDITHPADQIAYITQLFDSMDSFENPYDNNLKQVYELVSAFKKDREIIPVKLTVKEFVDERKSKLYVAVALNTTEGTIYMQAARQKDSDSYTPVPSVISITGLVENVNTKKTIP